MQLLNKVMDSDMSEYTMLYSPNISLQALYHLEIIILV